MTLYVIVHKETGTPYLEPLANIAGPGELVAPAFLSRDQATEFLAHPKRRLSAPHLEVMEFFRAEH